MKMTPKSMKTLKNLLKGISKMLLNTDSKTQQKKNKMK